MYLVYPELPPSSNKIYFRGTRLRREAREYKERFKYYVTRTYLSTLQQLNHDGAYAVTLRFFFPTVINETYGQGKNAAKTWYKKFDLTNRVKLLEDCVRDVIGIDDSQTFMACQEKHHSPDNPRVEVFIQEVDPDYFGVPRRPYVAR